jgi:hypothetical protein
MILNKVFILKDKADNLDYQLVFNAGEEFHIVTDVVYMRGHMLPPDLQNYIYNWLTENPNLFRIDNRRI